MMNSSNSFNICTHCGASNALSAKYCARCGKELKVPEAPVVCHNCRTANNALANFCRNCGAELKIGYATKLCPRCKNEVPAEQPVCPHCNYGFAQQEFASPYPVRADGTIDNGVTATGAEGGRQQAEGKKFKFGKPSTKSEGKSGSKSEGKKKVEKQYKDKGGRGFAIVALVLLLVFAYLIIAPSALRPAFLSDFDKGMYSYLPQEGETGEVDTAEHGPLYGLTMVLLLVNAFRSESFGDAVMSNGATVQAIIAVIVAIFAIAAVIHLIVCIVRSFRPRRSHKPNWCFLALAVLTTVVVGLIVLFNSIAVPETLAKVAGIFLVAEGWSLGYVLYAIPVYFWFFFLYSLIAKARVMKEQTVNVTPEQPTVA